MGASIPTAGDYRGESQPRLCQLFFTLHEQSCGIYVGVQGEVYRNRRRKQLYYRAIAPALYEQPQIVDPSRWLRGAMRGFPCFPITNDELLAIGNTKLPLLRYTRHLILTTDFYEPAERMTKEDGSVKSIDDYRPEEQERLIEDAIRQTSRIDDATDTLTTITSDHLHVFPKLELIQVGKRDWRESSSLSPWMIAEQGAVGCLLMRKLQPKYWCQFGSGGIFSHPSTRPVEFHRNQLPQIYTAHPNVGEDLVVLWGTINHLFVTDSITSSAKRITMGRTGLMEWVIEGIIGSYPECLGSAVQARCPTKIAAEKRTHFIIHNLILPEDGTHCSKLAEEWKEDLIRAIHRTSDRTVQHWRRLFEVLPPEEDDKYPRCGNGCR